MSKRHEKNLKVILNKRNMIINLMTKIFVIQGIKGNRFELFRRKVTLVNGKFWVIYKRVKIRTFHLFIKIKIKSLNRSFHANETFIHDIIVPNLNLFNCKIVHIIHGYFQCVGLSYIHSGFINDFKMPVCLRYYCSRL